MFGAILRAAPQALFIALLGAVLARVTDPLIDQMVAGGAEEGDLLLKTAQAGTENAVLVGILALLVVLIARAVIEAQMGRV